MGLTAEELPDDVQLLKQRILEQASQIQLQTLAIAYLELKLARMLHRRVSASIVQADDGQKLFDFVHACRADRPGRPCCVRQAERASCRRPSRRCPRLADLAARAHTLTKASRARQRD